MTPEEFWQTLHQLQPEVATTYRLYHDDQGRPLFYSMEHLPGTYIDVDAETFARASFTVKVKDGQLIELAKLEQRLAPSDTGTPCHPDNVAIVVSKTEPHQRWSMKTYETD